MTDPTGLPDPRRDRLFDLLPPVVRASDAYAGRPLQALLRVAAEQLAVVETDVARLLDNWFVETCDEWALPYLGELLGAAPNPAVPVPDPADDSPRGRGRARAAYPRRALARLVRSRRRKGVLLQLEELARDLTGWTARAVEFRAAVAVAANARFPELPCGRTVDLRDGDRLDRASGPFADLSRRPDVRRIGSPHTPGRGGLTAVGLFVWRLKVHAVRAGEPRLYSPPHQTHHHHHHSGDYRLDRYHLDPLALDRPLFARVEPLPAPNRPPGESEVPGPIRPRALRAHPDSYYGRDKSLLLWRAKPPGRHEPAPCDAPDDHEGSVPAVAVGDLERWEQSVADHSLVAEDSCWEGAVVDPVRGRVLVRRKRRDDRVLRARYHTAAPDDLGGGGYAREPAPPPDGVVTWDVGCTPTAAADGRFATLWEALAHWAHLKAAQPNEPRRVAIVIHDDATHPLHPPGEARAETSLGRGEYLAVRAAAHRRPVLRHAGGDDGDWTVTGDPAGAGPEPAFVLDGITLARTPLRVVGAFAEVRGRHCTLSAGPEWAGAVELQAFDGCLSLERCVVLGTVHVRPEPRPVACDPVTHRPVPPRDPPPVLRPPARLTVADSVIDGTFEHCEAVALGGWPDPAAAADATHGHPPGHVELTVLRSTLFGDVTVHALPLAEDAIVTGRLRVTDTGRGCVRFCSLGTHDPRTPPRHACQPDLALAAVRRRAVEPSAALAAVAPRFASTRPGDPAFAQLARDCPAAVARGASDESEMGAFHDLYAPYREALLAAGVADSAPADADAAVLFVN